MRQTARMRVAALATACVAAAAVAAGCQLTRQNYQAVSLGMPAGEARKILGAPRYELADEWVYTRDDPRDLTKVSLFFDDEEQVIGKAWQNPEKPWENHREGEVKRR